MSLKTLWLGDQVLGREEVWSPLLQEWSRILDRFARLLPDEPLEWMTEQAKAGLLPAVALQISGDEGSKTS